MLILTDDQFVEGIVGGWASLIAFFFLKKITGFDRNLLVGTLVSWCIFWWLRKIGMNIYIQEKKNYNIKDRKLHVSSKQFLFICIFLFGLILYHLSKSKIHWGKITRLSKVDVALLLLLPLVGYLVYKF